MKTRDRGEDRERDAAGGHGNPADVRDDVDPAQIAFEIDGTLHFASYMYAPTYDREMLDQGRKVVAVILERAQARAS